MLDWRRIGSINSYFAFLSLVWSVPKLYLHMPILEYVHFVNILHFNVLTLQNQTFSSNEYKLN